MRNDRPHSALALYPFTDRYLDLGGVRLHYLDEGAGEPLVMLHGNPTWSFFYRDLVRDLRADYRIVAPDHVGCGLSDKPDDARYPYTLQRRVADLEALLEHLGLRKDLTFVLHDWGGMIGMAFAHRHPERLKRLILLNTAAFHLPPGKRLPASLWLFRRTPLGPLLIRGLNAFCRGAARFCARRPLAPEVRAGYLAPYDSWANRIAVLRFVQDIPLRPGDPSYDLVTEVQDGLPRFRHVPTLICWGGRDFVFDGDFLAEWRRRLPWAEVHTFPDAGHYVLEDAGREIAGLVREFLGRHRLRSANAVMSATAVSAVGRAPATADTAVATNIAGTLTDRARERPDAPAILEPRGTRVRRRYTFRELDAESDRLARGLDRVGIGRGVRTVLMVPPSLEFYALTFALFKAGAVVVLIDPGMGVKNLGACLRDVEPEAFIGVPKAHVARLLFGWGRGSIRTCVTVGRQLGWGGWTLDDVRRFGAGPAYAAAEPEPGETAAILFTSGSTGVAKGAVYTHSIFAAQVELLRTVYGIEPGEIDLPTFPLFGLFGPALGLTAVIPEMDATRPGRADPRKLLGAVRHFGVTNLFGSPALIRRIAEYAPDSDRLPTLRRVISAGAPVPARVIEQLARRLADGVQVHTPYGATEALPVCTIGSDELLKETRHQTDRGAGVCVGRPVPGVTVRVIRITDEPIAAWDDAIEVPAGAVGEVVVRGPVVARSYFNRLDQTTLTKLTDPGGDVWHRMGDVGYFDAEGRLWFCGRKSQRVVTPAGTLFTVPCEGVFNAHPAVRRSALVGVMRNGATEPVLCVEREPAARLSDDELRRELLTLGAAHEPTRSIRTVLFHPSFPVDIRHNAKIFREKLAAWAAGRLR